MSDLKSSLAKATSDAQDKDWPRDFDFREAYAEQQELLDPAFSHLMAKPRSNGTDCNE
jgi:hypothetical protein